jgi:putative lipoprotein
MVVSFLSPRRLAPWLAASLSIAASACGIVPSDPSFSSLSGSIVQGDPSPLTPGSVVIVRLEDLSRRDGRVDVLAEQRIEELTPLPITFRLKYDGGEIDPDHRYVVTASVYAGSTIIYATDIPQNVITEGNPSRIKLVLERTVSPVNLNFISQ